MYIIHLENNYIFRQLQVAAYSYIAKLETNILHRKPS